MADKLKNLLYPLLKDKDFEDDNEIYLYLILQIITWLAFTIHVVLFGIYLFTNYKVMSLINCILSFTTYSFCLVLVQKREYQWVGMLISLEVILYSFITILVTERSNFIFLYLLIILVIQLVVPYASSDVRTAIVVFIWVGCIGIVLWEIIYAPQTELDTLDIILRVININTAVLGFLGELYAGDIIKNMVGDFRTEYLMRLENEAYTDPLTLLYNRRYADMFFERLKAEQGFTGWCIAMVDIDDFKRINDTHGHPVGDQVLIQLAEFIKGSFRKSDVLFRWGGEEFLFALRGIDKEQAFELLDNMRHRLSKLDMVVGELHLKITVTIGVAELDINNAQSSIERCDRNLYRGKNTGKNKVVI